MAYTDMERRILDMWPKYVDGEYVWIGDDVSGMDVRSFVFTESGVMVTNLTSVPAYGEFRKYGEPLKRPAPKVLDADGVEIKVGDTVWSTIGERCGQDVPHEVKGFDKYGCVLLEMHNETSTGWRPEYLTHTRPDSWERLEEDIAKNPCRYAEEVKRSKLHSCSECPWHSEVMARDIVRRAKALAEKEAGR